MRNESDELTPEELLESEEDILKGLLGAAETAKDEMRTIEIARKGQVFFRFRITGLSEEEYAEAREKATTYIRAKKLGGMKLPEDTDTTEYRSRLIYMATVAEDREKVWNNKKAWQALGVLSGPQLIDKVLLAGEKDKVVDFIDSLSGYDSNDMLEQTAKNSSRPEDEPTS